METRTLSAPKGVSMTHSRVCLAWTPTERPHLAAWPYSWAGGCCQRYYVLPIVSKQFTKRTELLTVLAGVDLGWLSQDTLLERNLGEGKGKENCVWKKQGKWEGMSPSNQVFFGFCRCVGEARMETALCLGILILSNFLWLLLIATLMYCLWKAQDFCSLTYTLLAFLGGHKVHSTDELVL